VAELANCPLCVEADLAAGYQFRVTGHRFEVFGYCADCENNGG
jgi:Fe2+ or Zn2+ uptake regulation protein